MAQARAEVLQRLAGQGAQPAAAARLAVRTSMRNQWPCVVRALEAAGPLVHVHLGGAGAAQALALTARITQESAQLLGLAPGLPVLALCKATAVQVCGMKEAGEGDAAPNAWPGRVTRVARGEAGDEVAAALDAGVQMVGFAPPRSGLRARARVCLRADASAIVLAL